jgi:hypothetical protein
MSVEEEEEDSAAEDSEVEQMAGAFRFKWFKDDDKLLRAATLIDLKKLNAARDAIVVGHDGQPRRYTCVSTFPQELSVEGVAHFADRRQMRASASLGVRGQGTLHENASRRESRALHGAAFCIIDTGPDSS